MIIVVITVPIVLAAVLYFMVSGLITDGGPPARIAVSISRAGTNWTLTIVSVSPGELPSSTFLRIQNSQAQTVLQATAFAVLSWPSHRAVYVDSNVGVAEIQRGDALVIDEQTYPTGDEIEISSGSAILFAGTLQ